jgi:hypothetical protein
LESQRPFLSTRFVLPTFQFKGVNEYLEEFLAQIDVPQVSLLPITFFNDIDLDTPELIQFINRTPTLGVYEVARLNFVIDEARLIFGSHEALVGLESLKLGRQPRQPYYRRVDVKILRQVSNWQLSSLAQICTLSLRLLLTMENLYIQDRHSQLSWKGDIENTEWLDLLHPFTAVKNLYLSKKFAPCIARALQGLTGGRATEVLPALQNVLLEGFQPSEPVQEGLAQFISARQLTNHAVAISVWNRMFLDDSEVRRSTIDKFLSDYNLPPR